MTQKDYNKFVDLVVEKMFGSQEQMRLKDLIEIKRKVRRELALFEVGCCLRVQ